MTRCLFCYAVLPPHEKHFHARCVKTFFGVSTPPSLSLPHDRLSEAARYIVSERVSVPGVQPKLSLHLEKKTPSGIPRMTLVGLWGEYILKPQTERYPQLPENEDLTMHLAQLCGIQTALHTLMMTDESEVVYLCKRFDRKAKEKVHPEDFCQLAEMLTVDKYHSSMEKVAKTVRRYSTNQAFDASRLFDLTLFSFLVGNADMHLKNFSLLWMEKDEYTLSPAYDLVNTAIVLPEDKEELALPLNGKKAKITKKDFDVFGDFLALPKKVQQHSFKRIEKKLPEMHRLVAESFLSDERKSLYSEVLKERSSRLFA